MIMAGVRHPVRIVNPISGRGTPSESHVVIFNEKKIETEYLNGPAEGARKQAAMAQTGEVSDAVTA
jgi:hypothetical protein